MNNIIEGGSMDTPQIVIIDIEEFSRKKECHPEYDPGVIIHYKIRIDGKYFEVSHRHMTGKAILELVGLSIEHHTLEQLRIEHEQIQFEQIGLDQIVDFGVLGIESFITKVKVYHFYIDKKKCETLESILTVRQILVDFANVDPTGKTLSEKKNNELVEHRNLDEKISLVHSPHFTLFDNDPCTVS